MFASRKSTSNSSSSSATTLLVYYENGVHYIDSRRTGRHYIYYDAGLQGQKKGSLVFLCCSCDEALGRNGCWLLRFLFFKDLKK